MSGIGSYLSGLLAFRHREDDTNDDDDARNGNTSTTIGSGGGGDGGPSGGYGAVAASDIFDQDEPQPESPDNIINPDDVENEEEAVQALTQRLRCLFTALTLPIIPIGTALSFLLMFVLYAAFVTDLHKECSAPLHGYAISSLILFIYAPNHRAVKMHLFDYSRERDGPARPRAVRMYDQLFQTVCLLYVYGGMTLIQTCADDVTNVPVDGGNDGSTEIGNSSGGSVGTTAAEAVAGAVGLRGQVSTKSANADLGDRTATISTCAATCPALYESTKTFVLTLQIFAMVLILPLLCLPCIYIWVVRRASAVAALAQLGRGQGRMSGDFDGPSFTAEEILSAMDLVRFVNAHDSSAPGDGSKVKIVTLAPGTPSTSATSANTLVSQESTVGSSHLDAETSLHRPSLMPSYRDREDVRECCICMTEFSIDNEDFLEERGELALDDPNSIVRTQCGHFFHRACLLRWFGGNWIEGESNPSMGRRAHRHACPLCREDLSPSVQNQVSASIPDQAIESTALLTGTGLV